MWAPTAELLTISSLAAALLAAASGSLHCVSMCGPLRLLCGNDAKSRIAYQGGRALAYLALGFLAGRAGAALPWWALLLVLALGIILSLGKFSIVPRRLQLLRERLYRLAGAQPIFLGLGSGLLPCGILHAWIAAAAATQHGLLGAALLGVLWLGSLPALELSAWLGNPLRKLQRQFPRLVPLTLVLLALVPISLRAYQSFKAQRTSTVEAGESCSFHQQH